MAFDIGNYVVTDVEYWLLVVVGILAFIQLFMWCYDRDKKDEEKR